MQLPANEVVVHHSGTSSEHSQQCILHFIDRPPVRFPQLLVYGEGAASERQHYHTRHFATYGVKLERKLQSVRRDRLIRPNANQDSSMSGTPNQLM